MILISNYPEEILNIESLVIALLIEADNREELTDGESSYKVYKFDHILKNPLDANPIVKDDVILKFDVQNGNKLVVTFILKLNDKNKELERIVFEPKSLYSKDEKLELIENIMSSLNINNQKNDIYNSFYHQDNIRIFFVLEEITTEEELWIK